MFVDWYSTTHLTRNTNVQKEICISDDIVWSEEDDDGQDEEDVVAVAAAAQPAEVIGEPIRGFCSIRFHEENPHAQDKYKDGGCPCKIPKDKTDLTDVQTDKYNFF